MEGRPLNEQDLIQRAKSGDVAAFEALVQTHRQIALRVAYLVVGDQTEAEDVTQEAFVKAHHAMSRFRADAPFRPWLRAGLCPAVSPARQRAGSGGTARVFSYPPVYLGSQPARLLALERTAARRACGTPNVAAL